MTDKRIIYNDDEGVSVITPWMGCGLTLTQIARKDVPFGKPYKIVDASAVPYDPEDPTVRDSWAVDDAEMTDGVGADFGAGSLNAVVGWKPDGTPITKRVETEA